MADPNAHPAKARRSVGLDRPCKACGQEIYYNYKGPFEGFCGRCTDRLQNRHKRDGKIRNVAVDRGARRGPGWFVVFLAFVAGAAAMYFLRDRLPF